MVQQLRVDSQLWCKSRIHRRLVCFWIVVSSDSQAKEISTDSGPDLSIGTADTMRSFRYANNMRERYGRHDNPNGLRSSCTRTSNNDDGRRDWYRRAFGIVNTAASSILAHVWLTRHRVKAR